MAAFRNAGQSGTRLPLAAGAEIQHFVVRQMARHFRLYKSCFLQQANRFGSARDAQHGAANQRHRAAGRRCGFNCRQDAGYIRRKASNGYFALLLGNCLKQTVADTGFRTCFAFREHVRAVADHG